MSQAQSLNRKLTFKFPYKEAEREYTIDFPDTGKIMDIELMKIQISDGKYDQMKFSFNPVFNEQAQIIDTIATLITLIPDLKKELNVTSILRLDVEQMSVLVTAYTEQFLPWYEQWQALLKNPKKTDEEEKK